MATQTRPGSDLAIARPQTASPRGVKVAAAGSRTAEFIESHEAQCVLAVLAIWIAACVWYTFRALWFDELFTLNLARLPQFSLLLRALPADGNPPLYYLLARPVLHLFGETEFAIRLPAILGYVSAALAVYRYIRRRQAAIFALFGMLVLLASPMANYGGEGRPYSLMLGFTGLTLVSWQAAADADTNRSRFLPLLGVAAGIAGALASHHYGVVQVGVALLFGESVRVVERRRLDLPLYLAAAAGLSMLLLTLPYASSSRHELFEYVRQSPVFWSKPSIWRLRTYGAVLAPWLPPVYLLLLWWTRSAYASPAPPDFKHDLRVPAHEIAAAAGLALMVPAIIVLTKLMIGYYMGRYAIGAAMGIALLAGLTVPWLGRTVHHASANAALCSILLVVACVAQPAKALLMSETDIRHAASALPGSLLRTTPGDEPIVIASACEYFQDWWYAPTQLRSRLHYLSDVPFAVHQRDFLPELSLVSAQPFFPPRLDPYRDYVSTHRRFYLYEIGDPKIEWAAGRLESEGWSVKPIARQGHFTLLLAEAR